MVFVVKDVDKFIILPVTFLKLNMSKLNIIYTLIISFFSLISPFFAYAIETDAQHASVMDFKTKAILFEKDATLKTHPSSMSKLMTLYTAFRAIADGNISLDQTFTISEKAWKAGGSTMFLEPNMQVKVEDLIKGIIVHSGNDASVAIAEGIAGSEEAFVERMNKHAKELNLNSSNFVNSTGMPHENHYMSAHDISNLAHALIAKFPQYYNYFGIQELTFNNITQPNRNGLIGEEGIDGLKTGHTEAGGYGVVISGKDSKDSRFIVTVNGLSSEKARLDEAKKLFVWAKHNFSVHTFATKNKPLAKINVAKGKQSTISLVLHDDASICLPSTTDIKLLKAEVITTDNIKAPLSTNQIIGTLRVSFGETHYDFPLYPEQDVNRAWTWRNLFR